MKLIAAICFLVVFLSALLAQQSGWVITPPSKSAPSFSARATEAMLASISNPALSLVLRTTRVANNYGRPEPTTLSIWLRNADGILSSNPDHPRFGPNDFLRDTDANLHSRGVVFQASFDGAKSLLTRWWEGEGVAEFQGQGGMRSCGGGMAACNDPDFSELMFLQKLRASKTLKVSYMTRAKENRSAVFNLTGIEEALASICPPQGCLLMHD